MRTHTFDIIIVGGGIVGASLALALAQASTLNIALLEAATQTPTWDEFNYHHRVSAITLASKQILSTLGVWPAIAKKRVSPFREIAVWDSAAQADMQFKAEAIAQAYLGYIVENNLVQSELLAAVKQYPQIQLISGVSLKSVSMDTNSISLISDQEHCYQARLAVAADGANSWLRQQSGIEVERTNYEHAAIVTHVKTSQPHQQIARQVFTKEGPLAFLPLADPKQCSIVWSIPSTQAQALLKLNDDAFKEALQSAFGERLGIVTDLYARYTFPLQYQKAKHYVRDRIVLVGDAAHQVHPLAGQGVNMGLLDAASLAEVILTAFAKRRDFSSKQTLRRYERWRTADNMGLLVGIEWIRQLFTSDDTFLLQLRKQGLTLANQWPFVKNIFTHHAIGKRGRLPVLAQRSHQ